MMRRELSYAKIQRCKRNYWPTSEKRWRKKLKRSKNICLAICCGKPTGHSARTSKDTKQRPAPLGAGLCFVNIYTCCTSLSRQDKLLGLKRKDSKVKTITPRVISFKNSPLEAARTKVLQTYSGTALTSTDSKLLTTLVTETIWKKIPALTANTIPLSVDKLKTRRKAKLYQTRRMIFRRRLLSISEFIWCISYNYKEY